MTNSWRSRLTAGSLVSGAQTASCVWCKKGVRLRSSRAPSQDAWCLWQRCFVFYVQVLCCLCCRMTQALPSYLLSAVGVPAHTCTGHACVPSVAERCIWNASSSQSDGQGNPRPSEPSSLSPQYENPQSASMVLSLASNDIIDDMEKCSFLLVR